MTSSHLKPGDLVIFTFGKGSNLTGSYVKKGIIISEDIVFERAFTVLLSDNQLIVAYDNELELFHACKDKKT
tara:strand:- start:204 stop:419 length:216 start_codon:yes stop_codon:yes gene_type:complete